MKSIDLRSNCHVINGRQNLFAAIGCGVLPFLLLSVSSGFAEPISVIWIGNYAKFLLDTNLRQSRINVGTTSWAAY